MEIQSIAETRAPTLLNLKLTICLQARDNRQLPQSLGLRHCGNAGYEEKNRFLLPILRQ
jgi:hypothetical protein